VCETHTPTLAALAERANERERTGTRPLSHFERRPGLWGEHVDKKTGEVKGENMLGKMLERKRTTL
jgi:hypothetical protein